MEEEEEGERKKKQQLVAVDDRDMTIVDLPAELLSSIFWLAGDAWFVHCVAARVCRAFEAASSVAPMRAIVKKRLLLDIRQIPVSVCNARVRVRVCACVCMSKMVMKSLLLCPARWQWHRHLTSRLHIPSRL